MAILPGLSKNLQSRLRDKCKEALVSVLPITGIVVVLTLSFVPISTALLMTFLVGGVLLIAGMMLFTLGAELSISPMGSYVGTVMTRSRKLPVVVGLSFLLGFIVTVSEPDLSVLAGQIPGIPNPVLILSVAFGVGCFLVLALLRIQLEQHQ